MTNLTRGWKFTSILGVSADGLDWWIEEVTHHKYALWVIPVHPIAVWCGFCTGHFSKGHGWDPPRFAQRNLLPQQHGASNQENLKNLKVVLIRLKEHGMWLKRSKCSFMQTSVTYLGHTRLMMPGGFTLPQRRWRPFSKPLHPKMWPSYVPFLACWTTTASLCRT